jgi:cell division protein ZapA
VDARQPIKVTIFNQTYALRSQGDPAELIQVAREVDELMHSIAEKAGSSDPSRVAVLACLHMADRLRALQAMKDQVSHRAEQFSALLEQVLESR